MKKKKKTVSMDDVFSSENLRAQYMVYECTISRYVDKSIDGKKKTIL